MIVIAAAIAGGTYGGWLARHRKGKRADIAQYAAGFALAFATVAVFVNVALVRMG